jgi:hypothetical protein
MAGTTKNAEGLAVAVIVGEHGAQDQRTDDRSRLVHCLVQAKPHPCPVWLLAYESIASRAGERMALPMRSAIISSTASSQRPVSAGAGTAKRLST